MMADQIGSGRPTPKVPYPRQLTKRETLDSLSHWQTSVRNYFRRFPEYCDFFKRSISWSPNSENYGFSGESAADHADNLEALLDTLATFMPGPYITHQITKSSKCIQDVWNSIWDHYGVKPTSSSFLDYDNLKMEKDERYIDLYDKLIYHSMNHLCQAGTDGGPLAGGVLTTSDTLTLSHRNLIALDWLRRINPSLIKLVKLEYSKDLKSGIPLASLVRDIAENIDSILHRSSSELSSTNVVNSDSAQEIQHSVQRVSSFPFRPRNPAANYRGFPTRPFTPRPPQPNIFSRPSNNRPTAFQKLFCKPCYSVGKKLNLTVDYSHSADSCPQGSTVRVVQGDDDAEQQDHHDYHPDFPGDNTIPFSNQSNLKSFPSTVHSIPFQNLSTSTMNSLETHLTSNLTWMDKVSSQVRNIESRWSLNVRKEKSPTLQMYLNQVLVYPTIDEGSEINVIDHDFAQSCNISFSRTAHHATAAGSHSMTVTGETNDDVVLQKHHNNHYIRWNLKKCIVVKNLGCPILIGEPAKKDNFISTIPSDKIISTLDTKGTPCSLPYDSKPVLYNRNFICRSNTLRVLFPGDKMAVDLPTMFAGDSEILFTPRYSTHKNDQTHLPAQTCTPQNNQVQIKNLGNLPIKILKNQHIGDLSPLSIITPHNLQNNYVSRLVNTTTPECYLDKVLLDPDNILSQEWKTHFMETLKQFSDIITPVPGCYNGFYGHIDCSLNFIQSPPSSNKARLPSYSHEKLVQMAHIMDEMESWGVLRKPHDLGITVKNVHTSYLVPKSDGSYRFVTDFTSLLPFIGKLEIVSPTISQAKRILSSFNYFIELDLSHCFWQGSMSSTDSAYLATPHPFGGIRCYAREPQGIRNASEHNSERLSIIFGDLERDKRMTRMADGLYVGGQDLNQLSQNLIEVLSRAKNCGLTFKPSKIVVCPVSTVLFGWKKTHDQWSPTSHVISPLSTSPPPKTVKQLRGWIGAYRQVSETIKDHAITLSLLEKETAGKKSREEIKWSPTLLENFEQAKQSLLKSQSVTIPKPSDTLHIYPDFSETANAVGGHLILERTENGLTTKKNGGFFSVRLDPSQSRWTPCEKEALGIKLNIEHFKPLITESNNTTIIHPDNMITVHAWNRLKRGIVSTSSKVAAFLSSLSENNIDIKHCPGVDTKVADYGSRHPQPCMEKRCQICKYMSDQCSIGEFCTVNSISVQDILSGKVQPPLLEKPAWREIQINDDTHNKLFKLITSGGLQPEKKLRGHTNLKLMYNMYKKGLLKIDSNGVIVIKHIDAPSGIEYNAISVPQRIYPAIIQSLHIKLQHPSRNQMHKFAHRYFHCIGSTTTIEDIHKSCQICTSLTTLPHSPSTFTTSKNDAFGSSFSADVMVSDNQKIFICREQLSQFTYSKIIEDESAESLRTAILHSVLDIIPSTGTTIRVDAAPGLQSISSALDNLCNDDLLRKHSITLEIGRTINPNKNPVAENAVKEFRKEKLRLNPRGGPISESDRILITKNINSRIRNRGYSAKELFFRRDIVSNNPIPVLDEDVAEAQYTLRSQSNMKHNNNIPKIDTPPFSVGDRVYIKTDLSKFRSREEYIITKLFDKDSESWALINKLETQFRKKSYEAKLTELIHVSTNFTQFPQPSHLTQTQNDDTAEPFPGFPTQVHEHERTKKLKQIISGLSDKIPTSRGRPRLQYPDYIHDIPIQEDISQEQFFHGFPTQTTSSINKVQVTDAPPLHGWIQKDIDDDDDEEDYLYFIPRNLTRTLSFSTLRDDKSEINKNSPYSLPLDLVPIDLLSDTESSDDENILNNSISRYISSDDDVFEDDTHLWWDTSNQELPENHTGQHLKSETDNNFLSDDNDDTIIPSPSLENLQTSSPLNTASLQDFPAESFVPEEVHQEFTSPHVLVPGQVYDCSTALDQLLLPVPNSVVCLDDMSPPSPLPRQRTSSRVRERVDYYKLHHFGK